MELLQAALGFYIMYKLFCFSITLFCYFAEKITERQKQPKKIK
jgi:hypothetical protein